MNAYTTRGHARVRQRDIDAILHTGAFLTGVSLAALDRQRGWQAEAELDRLLKEHGLTPRAGASLASRLRQKIGAVLIGAGRRPAGVPRGGVLPESVPAAGALGTGG